MSGKSHKDENFPVGSFLIAPDLRPVVHAYYRYARMADDVADDSNLDSRVKIDILDALERSVLGTEAVNSLASPEQLVAAATVGQVLKERCIATDVATDLLIAFRMDAKNKACKTWADLIDYCRYSACPVGRFLLALHGESGCGVETDALCCALQILNHIQDAQEDYKALKRVYIPTDWLSAGNISESDLLQERASEPLRNVVDRLLDHTDELLGRAVSLPLALQSWRLAAEASVCLTLARTLSKSLRAQDPFSTKVKLTRTDWIFAGLRSLPRLMAL